MNLTTVQTQSQAKTNLLPASGILQRKCACGSHTVEGGKCTGCSEKKQRLQREAVSVGDSGSPFIQRKLTVGASDDPLEKEADRIADQVMSTSANVAIDNHAPLRIQGFGRPSTEAIMEAPPSVDHVLSSPGRPLEPELRQDMEQRFGYDFSNVRTHSTPAADRSAKDLGANAYTSGNDIVFRTGQFEPTTSVGRRLIAHELTHVVQQLPPNGASFNTSAFPGIIKRDSEARHIQRRLAFTANPPEEITNQFVSLVNRLLPSGWRFGIHPMPTVRSGQLSEVSMRTMINEFPNAPDMSELELLEPGIGYLEHEPFFTISQPWKHRFRSELSRLVRDSEPIRFQLVSRGLNPETESFISDSFMLGLLDVTDLQSMTPIQAAASLIHALEERRGIIAEQTLEQVRARFPMRHSSAAIGPEAEVMGGLMRRECEQFTNPFGIDPDHPPRDTEFDLWIPYVAIANGVIIENSRVTATIWRMANREIIRSQRRFFNSLPDFRQNNPGGPLAAEQLCSQTDEDVAQLQPGVL